MRRHWRKSATAMAATALVVTAASTAFATTEPPGTEPAGTEAAGGAASGYDESATCGTDTNTSNVAKLEAPDPQTFVLTLCAPGPGDPGEGRVLVARRSRRASTSRTARASSTSRSAPARTA